MQATQHPSLRPAVRWPPSFMPLQVLQDQLRVSVRLTTAAQAVGFSAWLCHHAKLVVGLQLELAVDCCSKDIDTELQAVVQAVSTAAQANKVGAGPFGLQQTHWLLWPCHAA